MNQFMLEPMKSTLQLLADVIKSQKIDALLVGGYALQAYGVVRQTMDVDCLMAEADVDDVGEALEKAGYRRQAQTGTFRRYRHESPYFMDVDVLCVGRDTMDKMIPESKTFALEGAEYHVPALMHLIALKLHGIRNNAGRQAKDLGDIAELIRLNTEAVSRDELRQTCERFAPAELTDTIMGYLQ